MNGDLRTLAKLLIRFLGLYFLLWGLMEAVLIITNYIMVWTHVFFHDEIAVRPRMIEMVFEFLIFLTLYYKGTRVVDYLLENLEGPPIENVPDVK
jgi:hypothetical protein